jgi:hypothetical protein
MQVYPMKPDFDRYTDFACDRARDIRIFNAFDGAPRRGSWRSVAVSPITDDFPDITQIGDLSQVGTVPVASARAIAALEDLLTKDGELLELSTPLGRYFAYNITTIVPALDRAKTVAEWFEPGRIMIDEHLAFQDSRLEGHSFFRIPELLGRSYMTDIVADRVRKAKLTGFALVSIWPLSESAA